MAKFLEQSGIVLRGQRTWEDLIAAWDIATNEKPRSWRQAMIGKQIKEPAQPDHMRAGFEVFRAFERDAEDFARFAKTPLAMPMLVLTGEKASGEVLIQQARLVATHVEGVVIPGAGHWLMEEAGDQVIPKLVEFLGR